MVLTGVLQTPWRLRRLSQMSPYLATAPQRPAATRQLCTRQAHFSFHTVKIVICVSPEDVMMMMMTAMADVSGTSSDTEVNVQIQRGSASLPCRQRDRDSTENALHWRLLSCDAGPRIVLPPSSGYCTLKAKAANSSEASVNFSQTTRRHITKYPS